MAPRVASESERHLSDVIVY